MQSNSVTDVHDKNADLRDIKGPIRLGLWIIVLAFGGFVLWAILAPLDEGVPSSASIVIDTKRKPVQHMSGGIIREVLVKEGQHVKENEPLIVLNDTNTLAAFESARQQYFMVRAMQGRLQAETSGASQISFHPDLVKNSADPLARLHMSNQQALFESRRKLQSTEVSIVDQTLRAQQEQLKGARELVVQKRIQQKLLQDELSRVAGLIDQGFMPQSRRWELERNISEATGAVADLEATIGRLQQSIAEMEYRKKQSVQQFLKDVDTQMADVMRTLEADAQKYVALQAELDRTVVRAPATGQVIGLALQADGAVVQSGQKLMDIVPEKETLIVEAKIAPHLIDKVREGNLVDVRFTAFAHSPQLVVQGQVQTIAKDLLTDSSNPAMPGASYYLARIAITPEGIKELGDRQLQAGMPAEVIIKTGERTLMQYILHPLVKRMAASLKEE